jgi:hypothetical protein
MRSDLELSGRQNHELRTSLAELGRELARKDEEIANMRFLHSCQMKESVQESSLLKQEVDQWRSDYHRLEAELVKHIQQMHFNNA